MINADPMPSRVGRYDIVLPIAFGSTSTVYLARAHGVRDDRYLALKLTTPRPQESPSALAHRIERARLMTGLTHTNVLQPFDIGESEQGAFLVMEYIPGDSLAGLTKLARQAGSELPRAIALKILVDALHGLHAAHEHTDEGGSPLNLVHGDLSPRNILVGTDGVARLTHFGFANTEADFAERKASNLAPEQLRGEALDRRCDVWAAGVIAWEILTGQRLYEEGDQRVLDDSRPDPPRVKSIARETSDELDDLVFRALQRDRDLRITSALTFARELIAAAKAAGVFAETDDVATVVSRLVGPELIERKDLLAEARRQQDRPISAPDVRTLIGVEGPVPVKRPPLPSLPVLPPMVDDGHSELRLEVARSDKPAERADLDVFGAATAAPPQEADPQMFRSPLAPQIAPGSEPEREPTLEASREVAASPLDGSPAIRPSPVERARDVIRPWVTPPWTTKKVTAAAGVGGGLLGFLIVLAAASAGKPKAPGLATSSSAPAVATHARAMASNQAPSASAATNVAAAAAPTNVLDQASSLPASSLQIQANGPIASVTVVDRFVDAIVPTTTLNVGLEDNERGKPLRITVMGTDGRVATAIAKAGSRELHVTFGDKPRPVTKTTTAPTTTVKHPWSKRSR